MNNIITAIITNQFVIRLYFLILKLSFLFVSNEYAELRVFRVDKKIMKSIQKTIRSGEYIDMDQYYQETRERFIQKIRKAQSNRNFLISNLL